MKKNESLTDRIIRLLVGLMLIIVGIQLDIYWIQVVCFVVGALMLITSATGFCGLYKLLGICTDKSCKIKK